MKPTPANHGMRSRVGEQELIRRALDGDEAAEREIYERHVDRVYALTLRMAGDPELARVFTQDAFVRAFDRLDQFRGDAKLSTWLHRVTVSVTVGGLRKLNRRRERELPLEAAAYKTGSGTGDGVEPDLRERLHEAIRTLPEIYRLVCVMHDLEGYTHEEIADALEVAPGTSRARLSRARAMLREALAGFAEEYAT